MQASSGSSPWSRERTLEVAHACIGWALRFDYLSNGAGHKQSSVPGCPDLAGVEKSGRPVRRDIVHQYLAEVAARKRLSSSEEYRLSRAAHEGDARARTRLIEHHLGLVVMLARRYRNRGLPLLDLIEEGNIGLMLATRKFDPERGCRFSTYAKWWIRQSIELALMTQATVVRVPVYVTRELRRRSRRLGSVAPDVRQQTRTLSESPSAVDALLASVAVPEHDQPEWQLHVTHRRKRLLEALRALKHTERVVLEARFGLPDDASRTLQSIAKQLNVSSERVRQIQAEAIGKLRRLLTPDEH